jgi:hypothetical protein
MTSRIVFGIGTFNIKVAIKRQNRRGGDTVRALWQNLFNVKHLASSTYLEFTMIEVLSDPFNLDKTRITRL